MSEPPSQIAQCAANVVRPVRVFGKPTSCVHDLERELGMKDVHVSRLPSGDAEQYERRPAHDDGLQTKMTFSEVGVEGSNGRSRKHWRVSVYPIP
jgi:hypothetical protein